MGFDEVPSAGDEMHGCRPTSVWPVRSRRNASAKRQGIPRGDDGEGQLGEHVLEHGIRQSRRTLNLIIKADVQGSVEAVQAGTGEAEQRRSEGACAAHPRRRRRHHQGRRERLPARSTPIIIGFNVRPDASAREAAEREKVDVRLYTRHLQGDRGHGAGHEGPACAGVPRGCCWAMPRCAMCSRLRARALSPAAM